MNEYSIYNGQGRIILYFIGTADALALNVAEDRGFVAGKHNADEHYIVNGEAVARPDTGLPETHTIAANTDWLVPNIPQDTVVYVDDEDVGTVGTGDLILSFEFPATYSVRLEPPFPWKPATCEVTVT